MEPEQDSGSGFESTRIHWEHDKGSQPSSRNSEEKGEGSGGDRAGVRSEKEGLGQQFPCKTPECDTDIIDTSVTNKAST